MKTDTTASQRGNAISHRLASFSALATRWAGSSWGFSLAVLSVVVWAATGSFFDYSNTWQLVINTTTTIVTFLMVFLIQRSQNKESLAMQLKLNEIVAAIRGASNRMVDIEDLDEDELQTLRKYYAHLTKMSRAEHRLTESHSIAEAEERHRWKWGHSSKPSAKRRRLTGVQ